MIRIIFILLLLWPACALAWSGHVARVVDGDTIAVERNGERIRIRLYGIDCPESDQPGGDGATAFVRELLPAGAKVDIEEFDRDRFGRTVAVVRKDRMNINRRLVAAGHAWVYGYYCKSQFCSDWRDLQKKARAEKLGLWKVKNPVPPWKWRKR